MASGEIFPPSEGDGCEAYRLIASHLGCHEDDVYLAFRGVEIPEYVTPEHLAAVQEKTKHLNRAARHARNLHQSLFALGGDVCADLLQVGAVSIYQIEHLAWALERDKADLQSWVRSRGRSGKQNLAAHAIGEGIRRLFRRLRKPLTFGLSGISGDPSTDFGRAVEAALAAFAIKASWRSPAQKAAEKQLEIENRWRRRQSAKWDKS